ncbi:fused response regulator/phosphatase [Streptomyces sp. ODS05-4]|uniref:fused response regulator/phosphatase n=1 Tax=Streptomyces sp. ODS05-4 TaxID=2944939 RepID=UPI00210DC572|nr:fused response regulator/phosphatase [Streptomyces sp. ODS05-4]
MTIQRQRDERPALVLVVDDNPTNRYVLGTTLRRAGHRVVEAADGAEALAVLAQADPRPEAAIIDVRLPDMTGFDVCERIKLDPRTAFLPVIHISASAITVSDRTQGLNRGADAYLTEPIAPDELLATVTATLRYTRARRRAEDLAGQLARLNQITLRLYGATTTEQLARTAAEGAAAVLDAPADALLTAPDGEVTQLTAAGAGLPAEPRPRSPETPRYWERHSLADRVGAAVDTVARADWPVPVADPRPAVHPDAPAAEAAPGASDALAVALARTKPGRPPAAVVVPAAAVTTPHDRDLLTQVAHTTALALDALRSYDEEHALALTLQRSFLPEALPRTGRADLAVRYAPASQHAEIGGDFYEAVETSTGLVIAVGDVAGHSMEAAMLMGQVRHALRAYALDGHAPHEIHRRLERLLGTHERTVAVTLCVIHVPHDGDVLRISNAGHIPPLLRGPDGGIRMITEHGPLLGLALPHAPPTEVTAPPGTEILLVTDGLIERRGTDIDTSLGHLRDAFAQAPRDPDRLCDHLLDRFPPDGQDDVALLVARLR